MPRVRVDPLWLPPEAMPEPDCGDADGPWAEEDVEEDVEEVDFDGIGPG